jgi:hypothetical protein
VLARDSSRRCFTTCCILQQTHLLDAASACPAERHLWPAAGCVLGAAPRARRPRCARPRTARHGTRKKVARSRALRLAPDCTARAALPRLRRPLCLAIRRVGEAAEAGSKPTAAVSPGLCSMTIRLKFTSLCWCYLGCRGTEAHLRSFAFSRLAPVPACRTARERLTASPSPQRPDFAVRTAHGYGMHASRSAAAPERAVPSRR